MPRKVKNMDDMKLLAALQRASAAAGKSKGARKEKSRLELMTTEEKKAIRAVRVILGGLFGNEAKEHAASIFAILEDIYGADARAIVAEAAPKEFTEAQRATWKAKADARGFIAIAKETGLIDELKAAEAAAQAAAEAAAPIEAADKPTEAA